jgi:hypothetical protein
MMDHKEFDVVDVKGSAFDFIRDLNDEIYRLFAKNEGNYKITLVLDRNTNHTELTIEEISE